ncbi:MAG: deoxyguanosinetriphosphate triphosphohydrolase [Pseudomonadota bacterium]
MKAFEGISYGREGLAPYACFAGESKGRLFAEPVSPTRTPFQRDRDRIIHSTAFRRLKHKTQVFVHHVGDHYRTRLTHSIEVSQIARSLARALKVDEDLAECLALCHDFGHTPFGHAGEDTLDELMKEWGGFDHNAQSLRVVTELEQQYAGFDGLNLSWETLEGLVKHNGPLTGDDVPLSILNFNRTFDLELETHASIEAQCAAIADDIAYNAHDLDDGLRAGLFGLDDLADVPISGETLDFVRKKYPELEDRRVRHEIIRRQITTMVEDVISNSLANLDAVSPGSALDVRTCGKTIVCFGDQMIEKEKSIKAFLFDRVYRAPELMVMRHAAEKIIQDIFASYMQYPDTMPESLKKHVSRNPSGNTPRVVADFIASMTDSYAINEHQRLFDDTPDLG